MRQRTAFSDRPSTKRSKWQIFSRQCGYVGRPSSQISSADDFNSGISTAAMAQQQKDFQATAAQQEKEIQALAADLNKVSNQLELSRAAARTITND